MFYKEIIEQTGPGNAFLEHLESQILKNFPLHANHAGAFVGLLPGVVACTCNPATLEAEFRNGVGSIPVGGNSPSIGGWIV